MKLGFKITSKTLPNPLILAFDKEGGKRTHPYVMTDNIMSDSHPGENIN